MTDKCIRGTMMEFMGKRRWRASKDSQWATTNKGQMCGKVVGTRLIDGVRVGVIKTQEGKFFADHVEKSAPALVENSARRAESASTPSQPKPVTGGSE